MAGQAQAGDAPVLAVSGEQAAPKSLADQALPLPKWLMRIYYIFPIILYVPDAIFNFFVYSDGNGIDLQNITPLQIPLIVLWAFLAAGVVGMAWLLSVFAPWHWARGNKFQSIMCWVGVIIATGITIWNSLAYRSQRFTAFKTDQWVGLQGGFSLTMILVAVAPPFWGLFWAIVQPVETKRSRQTEELDFQAKIERMKQDAELKRVRAEANAQVRTAQIQGLAATARAARAQLGAAMSSGNTAESPVVDGSVTVTPEPEETPTSDRIVALPSGGTIRRLSDRRAALSGELTESGEHEIIRGAAAGNLSFSVAAPSRDDVYSAPEDGRATGEQGTIVTTSRTGMPRASTLLRNYAENEHVMRAVDADIEQMRARSMKITIKTFAEYRGIELSLSKQLLAKWREWKQNQSQSGEQRLEAAE